MKIKSFIPLLLLCVGCTSTEFTGQNGVRLKRTSFLQRNEIGLVEVRKDGTATMRGYKNDGGNEAVRTAVQAAIEAAASSVAPVP